MTTTCRACGATAQAWLCDTDTIDLETAIADLPALCEDLAIAMTRQSRTYRPNRPATEPAEDWRGADGALLTTPLPIDIAAADLLGKARSTLTTWIRHLAETRGIPVRIDDATRAGLTAWLLRNIDAVRHDEAAGVIHQQLTALRDEMRRAIDSAPSRIFAGPCTNIADRVTVTIVGGTRWTQTETGPCGRDLYAMPWRRDDGAKGEPRNIRCDGHRGDGKGCGASYTYAEREDFLRDSIEDALMPLDVLRAAVPKLFPAVVMPSAATWRSWLFRGRIEARGVDRQGRELVRGGDVMVLLWDERERPGRRRRQAAAG